MNPNLRTGLAAAALVGTTALGSVRLGPLPALGGFLDPAHGFWASVRHAELPDSARVVVAGMTGPVDVVYDDRHVPHIFGDTYHDVITALGYVVARDRLFQLDLQTRSTAGTLGEVLGSFALNIDRQARRLGLAEAAERNFNELTPRETAVLEAFADGVNAWIDQLHPRDYPFEYKLIGAAPARWQPVHTLYLMKRMGWTLTGDNIERRKLAAAARVGWDAADALFPVDAPVQEPIQVNGADGPRYDRPTFPPPGSPAPEAVRLLEVARAFGVVPPRDAAGEDAVGSNNWAVAPGRTRNGHAILAGDPHLGMSLPSVWYEVHTVVRDSLDVYGVTLPGAPGVIIGFNRNVAWSFTNTGADVMDWYREEVDDPDAPTRYRVDGEWRALTTRFEEYRGRGGRRLATDTLYRTHRGPMSRVGDEWWSMRWTVLEEQGEQQAFLNIMTASTVDEWLEGMTPYLAPAQNGIVADRNGSIAIRSHGRYPIRPGDGRGDLVRDGSSSGEDWIGAWPVRDYPFSIDPAQEYLASANQQPIDPRVAPRYLGATWPSPWRAIHINRLLRESTDLTPADLGAFQTDPGSARADMFAAAMEDAARRVLAEQPDEDLARGLERLSEWPRTYAPDDVGAVLFERAMDQLSFLTWDEFAGDDDLPFVRPGSAELATLLAQPESVWWDRSETTDVIETRDALLAEALRHAHERLSDELGDDPDGWRWKEHQTANVLHLLQINPLSALDIPVQGGPSTLAPSSGSGQHGASWRMVVEMGPEVRAWSIYPGGQSGNPVSSRYRDRVPTWSRGELEPVLFPATAAEIPADRRTASLQLGASR